MGFLKTKLVRKSHRLLGVFVGIQLLLWTVSGAYFALTDIDEIHGDHNRAEVETPKFGDAWVAPTSIDFEAAGRVRPEILESLSLIHIGETTYYRMIDAEGAVTLADAVTGEIREELDQDEALALATESFAHDVEIKSVQLLGDDDIGKHHEYRGGPLPAYAITFEHGSNTTVYVSTRDGRVVTHRNGIWRAFDFLWMLHTMDYVGRDDFNNPVLRVVAVLALVAVVSGYLLWGRTSALLRRRRTPSA